MSRKIHRRRFLRESAMAAASVLVAACAPPATVRPAATSTPPAPTAVAPTQPPVSAPKEAPMLAELVKAGKLPSLPERLPRQPKLVNEMPPALLKPEIGHYGGTLRTVTSVPDWDADVFIMNNEALLNTPGILAEEVTPNLVKDVAISPDHHEFTFSLRPGLRWSDGQPVTMADVRFAVEDVLFNKELTPTVPPWLRAANDPKNDVFEFDVVDDWTFRLRFSKPYGGFPVAVAIAGWRGYTELLKPAHFLKQYHIKYADAGKLEAAIKEAKLETWIQLFTLKDITNWELTRKDAIGFPCLYPWLLKEVSDQTYTFERNPYYHKVDAAGNQLPYIDRITSTQVANIETVAMKQIAGEVDFARESTALAKLPLYKENAAKGGYRVVANRMQNVTVNVLLNLTHKDPVWREVVRNAKFRRALNYAIDRKEIIDSVFYGFAELPTIVPSEYSVDKANALLNEIGMTRRDGDGFRLGPDGKTFGIPIETGAHHPDMIPTIELFVQYWNKVGISTTMRRIDQTLWTQRNNANELLATTMWRPFLWYQLNWGQLIWGPLWTRWFVTAGKDGEEPPEDVRAFLGKLFSLLAVPAADVPKVLSELSQLMYDQVYFFMPCDRPKQAVIANARLGNVSESPEAFGIANNHSAEWFYFRP